MKQVLIVEWLVSQLSDACQVRIDRVYEATWHGTFPMDYAEVDYLERMCEEDIVATRMEWNNYYIFA